MERSVRIHIQNPADDSSSPITAAQWQAAVARNPDLADFDVSIANDQAGFVAGVAEADILLTWVNIIAKHLRGGVLPEAAPRLRIIHSNSAGVDRLAPFDWLPKNVTLINNSGIQGEKAGEFAIMALLMMQNQMPVLIEGQRSGAWDQVFGTTLRGRILCIVGTGSIGSGVARRARAFGMHVIGVRAGTDPHPDYDETIPVDRLDDLLPRVDDLLLACPLTERTRNLLSKERIALLRNGSRIVNIARGAVWDQEVVCDALESGHLNAAFTDVTVPEPLPREHRLWRTRGMIITPHIAADDREHYNDLTLDLLLKNLRAYRDAQPMPNRVDPLKGY